MILCFLAWKKVDRSCMLVLAITRWKFTSEVSCSSMGITFLVGAGVGTDIDVGAGVGTDTDIPDWE